MIEGVIKGVIDLDNGGVLFGQAGGLPTQYETLVEVAGDGIGVQEGIALLNHELIDDDEMARIIAYSRVNPSFAADVELTRHKWLGVLQIELALKAGTVNAADASTWLAQDGIGEDQIAAFVSGAAAAKVTTHKQMTEAQITELFESGFFTNDQATAELVSLGYDPGEAPYILALYEQKRLIAMSQAAVGQIRKVYLAGRIDDPTATAELTALGISPDVVAQYIVIWNIEAKSELKQLTVAEIGDAVKAGNITNDDATARWEAMGYAPADAALLLAYYAGVLIPGSPAALAAANPTTPAA